MVLYDAQNKRLAVFETQATPEFWDGQWERESVQKRLKSGKTHHFIKTLTQKYVPAGGKILEGGCGTGEVVSCLRRWGYDASGVDFAEKTIRAVKEIDPTLPLFVEDVRHTHFSSETFDAYWSLGVIEHFWDGYDEIIQEAHRVLKPGGILFLSFPVMCPLRKMKARFNLYPRLDASASAADFYEFMLDQDAVAKQLRPMDFERVGIYMYDALKGIKDEVPFFGGTVQHLYKSRSPLARASRLALTMTLGRLTGHMTVLILRKTS